MRLDYSDYTRLVKESYIRKRSSDSLFSLARSTPGKIKKECLKVYQQRYINKDELILRRFFDPEETGKQLYLLIRKSDSDKFKALNNFLKGDTGKTEEKNLELLAWLIDFQHRPCVLNKEVILSEEESGLINKSEDEIEIEKVNLGFCEDKAKEKDEETASVEVVTETDTSNDTKKPSTEPISAATVKTGVRKNNYFSRAAVLLASLIISSIGLFFIAQSKKNPESKIAVALADVKPVKDDSLYLKREVDISAYNKNLNEAKVSDIDKPKKSSTDLILLMNRCQAITKQGTQCKRRAKKNGYCWQHG